MPDYVTIHDVELATVGMKWPTVGGDITITFEHLRDAMAAANFDPHVVEPRLKLGHADPRFNGDEADDHKALKSELSGDGDPALGVVRNLRLTNEGAVLVGDYTEVPAWLAETLPSAYPSRSIEGAYFVSESDGKLEGGWNVETPGGKRYSLVLTAVSLLGIYGPAVLDLEDLRNFIVDGKGVIVAGAPPKGGVPLSASIGGVPDPATAAASIDKVVDTFCHDFAQEERYYWWPRDVWTDPNEIIADDNEGGLWRIGFTSDEDQVVAFADPVQVLQTFEDAPAAAAAALTFLTRGSHPEETRPAAHFSRREETPVAGRSKGGGERSGKTEGMDQAAELRRVLGLSAEASDEDVRAALAAREGESETPPPAGNGNGDGDGDTPPAEGDEATEGDGEGDETPGEGTATEPEGEGPAAARADAPVTLDAEAYRQLKAGAEAGAAARTEQLRGRRDSILNAAVQNGKIPPARLSHYRDAWDGDPQGTEQLIDRLQAGLVPVDERGVSGEGAAAAASGAVSEDMMIALGFEQVARKVRVDG